MVIFSDGDLLEERHLPSDFGGGDKGQPAAPSPVAVELQPRQGAVVPLDEMEREAIMSALRQMGGNKTQAARALGIGLRTLHRKLKDYGYKDVQEPNERSLT